jgi:hypothetical protein
VDELRDDDWELVESRHVFQEMQRQFANGELPEREALYKVLADPLPEWLEAVVRQEESRPPLDDRSLSREQERCLRDLRRQARRARLPTYAALLRDLETADDDAEALTQVHRQVERELAQLETDERLSGRARIWSNL